MQDIVFAPSYRSFALVDAAGGVQLASPSSGDDGSASTDNSASQQAQGSNQQAQHLESKDKDLLSPRSSAHAPIRVHSFQVTNSLVAASALKVPPRSDS